MTDRLKATHAKQLAYQSSLHRPRSVAAAIRTSIGLFLVSFAFFAPHVSAQQPRGTTYAFLVGCSGYNRSELKTLPYTINDVSGFADCLMATGVASENIKLLHDKRTDNSGRFLSEKDKILKELKLLIAGIDRQDTLIVALSGHGVHFVGDKIGYFCPRDARLSYRKTLIPMEGDGGLYTILKDCPATRKLLLVNACRNGEATNRGCRGLCPRASSKIFDCTIVFGSMSLGAFRLQSGLNQFNF